MRSKGSEEEIMTTIGKGGGGGGGGSSKRGPFTHNHTSRRCGKVSLFQRRQRLTDDGYAFGTEVTLRCTWSNVAPCLWPLQEEIRRALTPTTTFLHC